MPEPKSNHRSPRLSQRNAVLAVRALLIGVCIFSIWLVAKRPGVTALEILAQSILLNVPLLIVLFSNQVDQFWKGSSGASADSGKIADKNFNSPWSTSFLAGSLIIVGLVVVQHLLK
jgi:hypothetical protein